jgi:competence protein ComEC
MKRRVVIFISCCFLFLGISLASIFTSFSVLLETCLFAAAVALFAAAFLFFEKRRIFMACLWLGLLFCGSWRYVISLPVDSPDSIWHYNGQEVEIGATVLSEAVDKPKSQSLVLGRLSLNGQRLVKGKIAVSAERWPEYEYGEILSLKCRLEAPGLIEDFDYGTYLAVQGIYSTCLRPEISSLGKGDSYRAIIWRPIVFCRQVFRRAVERGLNEPEAGLFKAFILGDKAVISEELSDKFRQSGLSHIVAISGTHITLLSGMMFFLLLSLGLSRRQAFYAVLPLLVFYVLLAGAPPSAVRSGFMGFLVLLAFHVGRLNRLDHSLVLSAAAMLLINPKLLVFDIGFQLSFAAVLGMIYFYPPLDRFFERCYRGRPGALKYVCQMLALTLAAQVLTTPVLFWKFKQISLVAPLANLFAVWIAPFIMGFGLAASALSMVFPSLAQFWFLPAGLCLKYLIFTAKFFSGFIWAYWKIGG